MLKTKVEKLLADYRPEHSEFQMENFIIGGAGHPWGRYKQALRELAARHPGIATDRAEIAALAVDVKRSEARAWYPIGREERQFKTALMRSRLKEKRERFKSRMREYAVFYRVAKELKKEIGEVTAKRRRELETEAWIDKARRMAAIDLISIGGIQRSTAEFLISLPADHRRAIFQDLRQENRNKFLSIMD